MKQRIIGIIIAFICLLDAKQGLSQTPPNGMLYQAVARDAMLRLARNRTVFIRTSLIQGNPTGSVVYSEEHISNTNVEGVFSIVIGKGINKTGTYTDIKSIPWSSDRFYFNIQLSVAPVLPSTGWMPSYVDMGTTEFWTVPYAFYSGSAQTSSDSLKLVINKENRSISLGNYLPIEFSVRDEDSDSTNELQRLTRDGGRVSLNQKGGFIFLPDSSAINEIQSLILDGGRISLSLGGGTISLPDSSSSNELQKLSQSGNTISLSNGGGSVSITDNDKQSLSLKSGSLSISNGNSVTLPDSDNTNEIQKLGISGGRVTLDNGGGSISLPDSSSSNELQKLSQSGNTISLSNGGGSVSITDNDKQSLSLKSGSLSISNGNSVTLPDSDSTNEIQVLSMSKDTLFISGGNFVVIPSVNSTGSISHGMIEFKSSGTWVVPKGVNWAKVTLIGSGGGGGRNSGSKGYQWGGGGGGAGAYLHAWVPMKSSDTITLNIGKGGAGAQQEYSKGFDGQKTELIDGLGNTLAEVGGGSAGTGSFTSSGKGGSGSIGKLY